MKQPLFLLFTLAFIFSCSNVKKPQFRRVEHVKLGKVGLAETGLTAKLLFSNPNKFGFRVKTIDCDIYIDSSFLGHFNNTEAVNVHARDSFLVPVTGQIQTLLLMSQTKKALDGKESIIRMEGKARIGRSGVYKNFPFTYRDTLLLKL